MLRCCMGCRGRMLPSATYMPHPRCAACDRHRDCAGTLYPRRPCLCAAFVGTANSKACPRSLFQVKTESACRSLAAIADKLYGGSVNFSSVPPGCFWLNVGGGVYLNIHATGDAHPNAQQLCAGAPAPVSQAQTRRRTPVPAPCSGACQQERGCDCRVQRDGAHAEPSRRYGRCMAHNPHGLPHAHRLSHAQGSGAWELCAAFAIGGTNGDSCPQNYSRLKTEEACASLGAIAGVSTYAGSDEYSYYPIGCFRHTVSGNFYWNTHGSGANNSFAQPLCAGAPASHAPCVPL
jgi:hypothetical protein